MLECEGKKGQEKSSGLDEENRDKNAQQPASQDIDQVMHTQ